MHTADVSHARTVAGAPVGAGSSNEDDRFLSSGATVGAGSSNEDDRFLSSRMAAESSVASGHEDMESDVDAAPGFGESSEAGASTSSSSNAAAAAHVK